MKDNPWRIHATREAFSNPWIRILDHDVTKPDGSPGRYGVVDFQNLALAILPIDEEGCTYLVGQHRFPLGAYSWEVPEGGGAKDETPLVAAKRELKEETGFTATDWRPYLEMDMSNSVTNETAIGYLAWTLTEGAPDPDPTEVLQVRREPFDKVLKMVVEGEIRDALTVAMVLKADFMARHGGFPDHIAELLRG